MSDLFLELEGKSGIFALYDQNGDEAYFSLYKSVDRQIFASARVEPISCLQGLEEEDVEMIWSSDLARCCLALNGHPIVSLMISEPAAKIATVNGEETGIRDNDELEVFGLPNVPDFVSARREYWRRELKRKLDKGKPC